MKLVTGVLAAVLLVAGVGASHAVVRIADDRGGRIGDYVNKYQGLRSSGETVVIDGLCASACTIVLGAIPHGYERGVCDIWFVNRYQVIVLILDVCSCIYVPPALSRSSNRLHDSERRLHDGDPPRSMLRWSRS